MRHRQGGPLLRLQRLYLQIDPCNNPREIRWTQRPPILVGPAVARATRKRAGSVRPAGGTAPVHHRLRSIQVSPVSETQTSKRFSAHLSGTSLFSTRISNASTRWRIRRNVPAEVAQVGAGAHRTRSLPPLGALFRHCLPIFSAHKFMHCLLDSSYKGEIHIAGPPVGYSVTVFLELDCR